MKDTIYMDQANELSLHTDFNFFWKFEDFNIYEVTVPDRMYMLDLEITKYLLEFTREFLRQKVNARASAGVGQCPTEFSMSWTSWTGHVLNMFWTFYLRLYLYITYV